MDFLRRLAVIGLLMAMAVPSQMLAGDIVVTVKRVQDTGGGIDVDLLFNNQAEFYARVKIGAGTDQVSGWIPGKDLVELNFSATETVSPDERFQPVHIEIWDHDQIDDFSDDTDDHCDVNPTSGFRNLDLTFDTCTMRWTGSLVGGPEDDRAPGAGDSDAAEIVFGIATGDGRPFSPDDVAISRAAPVQVTYDPDFIVSGKATAMRVDFTSSYLVPRAGTVTVRMRDGLGNEVEETRSITVPPTGRTEFFFDGSAGVGPFVPFGNSNNSSFCWDVSADFGTEGPPSPPPAFFKCYDENNLVSDHCKRMVFIDNPETVYMGWDWETSPVFATPGVLADTFNSGEDFRLATSPIPTATSSVAPMLLATPGPAPEWEPIPSMILLSPLAMMAGIDRLVLVPRQGWFTDNADDVVVPGAIGISGGEFLRRVVVAEAGFSQVVAHEIGHTYKLSQRNCLTGGFWEYALGVGCRDEYKHVPGVPAPYPALGFDVLGQIYPSGSSPLVPGTRDVNSLNVMGATGAPTFTYDRWIDDLNYNFLLREMAAVTPGPPARGAVPAATEVFSITGAVEATNGIGGSPPQFSGMLFPGYRLPIATVSPDLLEAAPGEESGSGPFKIKLITAQGVRTYRFLPSFLLPEVDVPQDSGFFSFAIPWDDTTTRVELHGPADLYDPAQSQDVLLIAMDRTAALPAVQNVRIGIDVPPAQPSQVPPTIGPGDGIGIAWDVVDPDSLGHATSILLLPPLQLFGTPLPLAANETDGTFRLSPEQTQSLPPGAYGLRFYTSDGVNSSYFDVFTAFDVCAWTNGGVETCDGVDNDCNGLVDDATAPGPVGGVRLGLPDLSWDASAAASVYDVVAGSISALRAAGGDFTALPLDCLAEDLPATSLTHTAQPPDGDGFWFLVRAADCGGDGTWNSDAPEASPDRDPGLEASAGSCPDCAHGRCQQGEALTTSCDPCVAEICSFDSYCCSTAWDATCVQEMRTVCGNLTCAEAAGTCAHTVCLEGEALTSGCDDPPVNPSCVESICADDPYCCATAWDFVCMEEVTSICGANCD